MDARDRQETPHTPLGSLWLTIRHWLVAHTFAPPFLTGRWSHPAVGYLLAVLLQVVTVTGLVELIRLFPSFQFQEAHSSWSSWWWPSPGERVQVCWPRWWERFC